MNEDSRQENTEATKFCKILLILPLLLIFYSHLFVLVEDSMTRTYSELDSGDRQKHGTSHSSSTSSPSVGSLSSREEAHGDQ